MLKTTPAIGLALLIPLPMAAAQPQPEVLGFDTAATQILGVSAADLFGDGAADVLVSTGAGLYYAYEPGRYVYGELSGPAQHAAALARNASNAASRTLAAISGGPSPLVMLPTPASYSDRVALSVPSVAAPLGLATYPCSVPGFGFYAVLDDNGDGSWEIFLTPAELESAEPYAGSYTLVSTTPSAAPDRFALADVDGDLDPDIVMLFGNTVVVDSPHQTSPAPYTNAAAAAGGVLCACRRGTRDHIAWVYPRATNGGWKWTVEELALAGGVLQVQASVSSPATYATAPELRGVAAGDYDADGSDDLCVALADRAHIVRHDTKSMTLFVDAELAPPTSDYGDAGPPLLRDLDGDGDADAVTVYGNPPSLVLHRSDYRDHADHALRIEPATSAYYTTQSGGDLVHDLQLTVQAPPEPISYDTVRLLVWRAPIDPGVGFLAAPPAIEEAVFAGEFAAGAPVHARFLTSAAGDDAFYIELRAVDHSVMPARTAASGVTIAYRSTQYPMTAVAWGDLLGDPPPGNPAVKGIPPDNIRIFKSRIIGKQRPNPVTP